ncbi:MAG: ferredoxin [Polaromonas sp.]|jgi:ferredoxin|nr:ferredoxin [Polaromonas sp.]
MPEPKPTRPLHLTDPASLVYSACMAGDGTVFEAPAALPLLLAAERAGVWLRDSSCRNGTCRTCLCRLVSGQVVYRIDWPGLSLDEKRDGFILPCVAHPASDVVIEALL